MKHILSVILITVLAVSSTARAEFRTIDLTIFGMD